MIESNIPKIETWKRARMKGSGRCFRGNEYWSENTLWEYAKIQEYKPFDLPLAGIPLDVVPWDMNNIEDIAYHIKKVQEADLRYPIILDDFGNIRDGYHRLLKALMEGRLTIKAVRFDSMPEPDGREE